MDEGVVEINRLEAEIAEEDVLIRDNNNEVEELKEAHSDMKQTFQSNLMAIMTLNKENSQLKSEVDEMSHGMDGQIEKLREELMSLEMEIADAKVC